jgi:hypothetical protein
MAEVGAAYSRAWHGDEQPAQGRANGCHDYLTALEQATLVINAIAVADSDTPRFVGRIAGS